MKPLPMQETRPETLINQALYANYGKLKKQVKEYDVIKQNIDSILQTEKQPEHGNETERE